MTHICPSTRRTQQYEDTYVLVGRGHMYISRKAVLLKTCVIKKTES
jgi:hypothetical protein